MPIACATVTGSAPIECNWSTTTSTSPWPAAAASSSRSAASVLSTSRSSNRVPSGARPQAWWAYLPTSSPITTS